MEWVAEGLRTNARIAAFTGRAAGGAEATRPDRKPPPLTTPHQTSRATTRRAAGLMVEARATRAAAAAVLDPTDTDLISFFISYKISYYSIL